MRAMSDLGIAFLIVLLIVLFVGEPDISDSIRKYIDAKTTVINERNQNVNTH